MNFGVKGFVKIMKASLLKNFKKWEYTDINIPSNVNSTKALIKITLSGICSTDIVRSIETGFYFYPIVPGHEMVGIVEKINKKNKLLKKGDRVAVYPLIPCKKCQYCKNGSPNLCDNYDFLGSRSNGGYAEYVIAPIKNLIKIPNKVPDNKAVFTEPLSVALHAFRVAENFKKPKRILILGLGPIGLLLAIWAKHKKIKSVVAIDRNINRFKIFKKIGYKNILDSSKKNFENKINKTENFDTVFECSGSTKLQIIGINKTEKKGQFIILSHPKEDLLLDKTTYSKILRNEINFRGSWSSKIEPYNEWKKTLSILSLGKIDPSKLISDKITLKELPFKMIKMYKKEFPFVKVVVNLKLNN